MAGDNSGKAILGAGFIALVAGGTFLGYEYLKKKNTSSPTSVTSTPVTSSYTPVLTTINWNVNTTTIPNTGGNLTFTIQALDQYGNPYAGASPSLIESENSINTPLGSFPATNQNGYSSFNAVIPSNPSNSSLTMVFTLGGI